MQRSKPTLTIASTTPPKVLFLGNGLLRLTDGLDWAKLLKEVSLFSMQEEILKQLPFSMQPEALCGVNVEEVQRKTAARISTKTAHQLLKRLLAIPFDAIITTNYAYEVEEVLTGKEWNERQRSKTRSFLHSSHHVRHNTSLCDVIMTPDQRYVPVFHPHGDQMRKHSLILSYYSYASSVHHLIDLNRERGNIYYERQMEQAPIEVWSWLDYFVMGEVHAVGFGFDLSEFDIWWAIERKAREKAAHGRLHAWLIRNGDQICPQKTLFDSMDVDAQFVQLNEKNYTAAYERIIDGIDQA